MENFADINVLSNILPSLQNLTPHEIMDKLNAYRSTNKAQISKLDKKLYIGESPRLTPGNLPPSISERQLLDSINSALEKMNVNQDEPGDSALDAWISPDGHFSYVEFRNKDESEQALCLAKVKVGGYQLRVSRAKAYAKILVDPSMVSDEFNKGLVMSARSNILFKDIDINKGRRGGAGSEGGWANRRHRLAELGVLRGAAVGSAGAQKRHLPRGAGGRRGIRRDHEGHAARGLQVRDGSADQNPQVRP